MKHSKNIKDKLLIISLVLLSLFTYSCGSTEEDTYVTTELNGLYRYKSLYATKTCNASDDTYSENSGPDDNFYSEDSTNEKIQPYFILEGRKELDESINDLLLYYCEDRRFNTCNKNYEKLFAKGADGNWIFENTLSAKYDYLRKTCIFSKDYAKEYNFTDDKLEIKTEFYSYEDSSVSRGDCKIKNINYSDLRCIKKKRYRMKRELISQKDQAYFEEQTKKEDTQN
jgi:hypothetical protein